MDVLGLVFILEHVIIGISSDEQGYVLPVITAERSRSSKCVRFSDRWVLLRFQLWRIARSPFLNERGGRA